MKRRSLLTSFFTITILLFSCGGGSSSSGIENVIRTHYAKKHTGPEDMLKVENVKFVKDFLVEDSMNIVMNSMGPQLVDSYEKTMNTIENLSGSVAEKLEAYENAASEGRKQYTKNEYDRFAKSLDHHIEWINAIADAMEGKTIEENRETDKSYLKRNGIAYQLNRYNALKKRGEKTVIGKVYYADVQYRVKVSNGLKMYYDKGEHLVSSDLMKYISYFDNINNSNEFDISKYKFERYSKK